MNEKKKAQFDQIRRLAVEHGVEIVAHFFQREEVKAVADFVGGAQEVVARAVRSEASAVMVCGASFMIADIERQGISGSLLVPRRDLACPLAEAVTLEEVLEAERLYPDALVAADIKVSPEIRARADLIISPAAAAEQLAQTDGRQLIVLPGPQLADRAGYGGQVVNRWAKAVCRVQEQAMPTELEAAQQEHPEAMTAVHYLTRQEIQTRADFVGDSAAIRHYCAETGGREFIIVAETGLAEYLAEIMPEKIFFQTEAEIFCPNMKLTTLKTMVTSLEQYASGKD